MLDAHRLLRLLTAALIAAFSCVTALAEPAPTSPLFIAPTVEGLLLCDEAVSQPDIQSIEQADAYCAERGLDGSAALTRLLDELEPGGPAGEVHLGYMLTVQLLSLYTKTETGWVFDENRLERFLNVVRKVKRPVVMYLAADHFDSIAPLATELGQDPVNLMQLADGKPPQLGYFGYPIHPYTLSTDPAIPVNRYRFEALEQLAAAVRKLPSDAQDRIVAYTLAGELHQLFPDFQNGMGAYQDIQVTDYSPASVQGFRQWLQRKYRSIERYRSQTGLQASHFETINAPGKDIRVTALNDFSEHYDAYADGILPIAGWLWDPQQRINRLGLYVDGRWHAEIARGLNRLDVYRAVDEVTSPNTGFRHDLDFSHLSPGRHVAQVVAESAGRNHLLGRVEFTVMDRDQSQPPKARTRQLGRMPAWSKLKKNRVRAWLDMPAGHIDVYYNPLARDWNEYRAGQVRDFLQAFHQRAIDAGLPRNKLYSHQIVPEVNSSWNPQLFASTLTLDGKTNWNHGLNMYGGATDSDWLRRFMQARGIGPGYGVPEFNPQQWKRDGAHLAALQAHLEAGARFISPYYFSTIPERFKGTAEHGVNRMELSPDNPQDGSDRFYHAIMEFVRR